MSSRGRRRAPARHASPKSLSRFLGPIAFGAVLVLGGSAATGTPAVVTSQTGNSLIASGSHTKAPSVKAPSAKAPKAKAPSVKKQVAKAHHAKVATGARITRTVTRVAHFHISSKIVHSANVERGTKILRSKGVKGTIRFVYKVKVLKGKTIARTLVAKKVVNNAKPAVYIVGTGKPVGLNIDAKAAAGNTGTPRGNMHLRRHTLPKSTVGIRRSSVALFLFGIAKAIGTMRLEIAIAVPMESRRPCPAARCRSLAPTGRPTQ